MGVKLISVKAKEIFTKSKLPGCEWVLNQYVGCQHACLYCYAKFISRWRPADYGRWGSWVEAKINAAELVENRYVDGWVFMSSISDPYQQAEAELKLTRRILENLDKKTRLSVLTKSDLVLRDIDLFKQFKDIEIGLTINDFSGNSKKIFEPFSACSQERINALKTLKSAGIRTYAFVSPIIPGLTDFGNIIENTRQFADYYWFEFINMRGAGTEFARQLNTCHPESIAIMNNKKNFSKYLHKVKELISTNNIVVKGIETH
jgi:DNA repair photolyase